MSVCLYLTGLALNAHEGTEGRFPFRLGLLTRADAALLGLLVVFIIYRKRSLFTLAAAQAGAIEKLEQAGEAGGSVRAGVAQGAREMMQAELEQSTGDSKRLGGWMSGLARRVSGEAAARARTLGERLAGKPSEVDELQRAWDKWMEKSDQIDALESVRPSMTPESYEEVRNRCRGELAFLTMEARPASGARR